VAGICYSTSVIVIARFLRFERVALAAHAPLANLAKDFVARVHNTNTRFANLPIGTFPTVATTAIVTAAQAITSGLASTLSAESTGICATISACDAGDIAHARAVVHHAIAPSFTASKHVCYRECETASLPFGTIDDNYDALLVLQGSCHGVTADRRCAA
jgi:hypothetical protein